MELCVPFVIKEFKTKTAHESKKHILIVSPPFRKDTGCHFANKFLNCRKGTPSMRVPGTEGRRTRKVSYFPVLHALGILHVLKSRTQYNYYVWEERPANIFISRYHTQWTKTWRGWSPGAKPCYWHTEQRTLRRRHSAPSCSLLALSLSHM